MRAFASQKGPGKGLPASGFAPETREKPRIPPSHNSTLPLPKPLGSSRILSDPPSPSIYTMIEPKGSSFLTLRTKSKLYLKKVDL